MISYESTKSILEIKFHELDPLFLSISKEETIQVFEQRLACMTQVEPSLVELCMNFVTEHFYASKSMCEALWSEQVRDADIRERFNKAIQTLSAVDITPDLNRIEEDYLSNAV